jgi:riboflavin synthase
MFTGIIETLAKVEVISVKQTNIEFVFSSTLSDTLKIDQSVAHNGVCLTVTQVLEGQHTVCAIAETLAKTNLGNLRVGDFVNLERCMQMNGRLDGHIVQGHVDQTAICKSVENKDGSWLYTFEYDASTGNLTIEKGSISVNGVSLTVVNAGLNVFSVAIIPYTFEHTTFQYLKTGDLVNLEFDVLGKYVAKYMMAIHSK